MYKLFKERICRIIYLTGFKVYIYIQLNHLSQSKVHIRVMRFIKNNVCKSVATAVVSYLVM